MSGSQYGDFRLDHFPRTHKSEKQPSHGSKHPDSETSRSGATAHTSSSQDSTYVPAGSQGHPGPDANPDVPRDPQGHPGPKAPCDPQGHPGLTVNPIASRDPLGHPVHKAPCDSQARSQDSQGLNACPDAPCDDLGHPDPKVPRDPQGPPREPRDPQCNPGPYVTPIRSLHLSSALDPRGIPRNTATSSAPLPVETSTGLITPVAGEIASPATDLSCLVPQPSRRRPRMQYTPQQLVVLDDAFARKKYPTREDREVLKGLTGLTVERIKIWFQNRRSREKRREKEQLARGTASSATVTSPSWPYPAAPTEVKHMSATPSGMQQLDRGKATGSSAVSTASMSTTTGGPLKEQLTGRYYPPIISPYTWEAKQAALATGMIEKPLLLDQMSASSTPNHGKFSTDFTAPYWGRYGHCTNPWQYWNMYSTAAQQHYAGLKNPLFFPNAYNLAQIYDYCYPKSSTGPITIHHPAYNEILLPASSASDDIGRQTPESDKGEHGSRTSHGEITSLVDDSENGKFRSPKYRKLTPVPLPPTPQGNEPPDTTTGDWEGRLEYYECDMQSTLGGDAGYQSRSANQETYFAEMDEQPQVIKLPGFSAVSSCSQDDYYTSKYLRSDWQADAEDSSQDISSTLGAQDATPVLEGKMPRDAEPERAKKTHEMTRATVKPVDASEVSGLSG